jgi:hypothetical protein
MNTIPEDLYNKIQKISENVRKELRSKGLVVPVQNSDGTVGIGPFSIKRDQYGYYAILDHTNDPIITGINLPQTAILVANRMALSYYRDDALLADDRRYGYADFEEALYKRGSKDLDRYGVYLSKYSQSRLKKQTYKRSITNSFQKLVKLV